MSRLLRHALGDAILLRITVPENLPSVICDPRQLDDALLNPGLGLTAVCNFVERWSGSVEIQSSEARGTCVRLHLPASGAV